MSLLANVSLAVLPFIAVILAHTLYFVPTVSPDGQVNVPVKAPITTAGFEPPTLLNVLQLSVLYPKVTDPVVTVPTVGAIDGVVDDGKTFVVMPEPVTVIFVPADPDVGVLVTAPPIACACPYVCAWAGAAILQSMTDANNSIAEHSTNAMLEETIFDRFPFVFMFALPERA